MLFQDDKAFARANQITLDYAIAYRRGWEAHERGSSLHASPTRSIFDAWYCAGFHDADIAAGRSILQGREL